MRKYNKYFVLLFALLIAISCQKDDFTFGSLDTPKNLEVTFEIIGKTAETPYGDGSGLVNFKATADGVVSYKYTFSDGTSLSAPNGTLAKRFTKTGINKYTVAAIAYGRGGVATTITLEVEVFSNFRDDQAVQFLTGGTSKKWYWSASEAGHLGVGPNDDNAAKNFYPDYYAAVPFEKAGSPASSCLYENVLTFSLVGGQLKYELDNGGATFFNASFESVGGGSSGSDACLAYNTSGTKTVLLGPSDSFVMKNPKHAEQTRGTMLNFS
ncbi:MAG: glycoside hydrolase family 16 protein, partial [Flavobacterium sp.]